MNTFRSLKLLLLLAASLLLLQSHALAQSGRNPPRLQPTPASTPAPAPTPIDNTHYEKVKVLVSRGLDDFVKDLDELGRLGYRLEKTVSYGDTNEQQRYAAVLHLDPGHTYDYAWEPTPDREIYGYPFNYQARRGSTTRRGGASTSCTRTPCCSARRRSISPTPATRTTGPGRRCSTR